MSKDELLEERTKGSEEEVVVGDIQNKNVPILKSKESYSVHSFPVYIQLINN